MRQLPWIVPAAGLVLGGCLFQHFSPAQQLTEQAYALNDEARWARIDLASERVAPRYRAAFLSSHREWGARIQIADADMTNVVLGEDDTATSLVRVSWYDVTTMEAHATTLRQRWIKTDGGYLLDGEEVIGGDEALLQLPDEDRARVETEG